MSHVWKKKLEVTQIYWKDKGGSSEKVRTQEVWFSEPTFSKRVRFLFGDFIHLSSVFESKDL